MSASAQKERSQRNAADLLKRGFFHGKRQSKPYANSGGTTMTPGPGSSKAQRRKNSQVR